MGLIPAEVSLAPPAAERVVPYTSNPLLLRPVEFENDGTLFRWLGQGKDRQIEDRSKERTKNVVLPFATPNPIFPVAHNTSTVSDIVVQVLKSIKQSETAYSERNWSPGALPPSF